MKPNILKYIAIALSVVLLTGILYSCGLVVHAEVPNAQKVSKRTGVWGVFPFEVKTDNYYIIEDPTGLSISSYTDPTYYYTNDNVEFYPINGKLTFVSVLNSFVGVILEASNVTDFWSEFCSITGTLDQSQKYAKNGLYDTANNFYGYCINDIGGCYYGRSEPETVTVSKDYSDNVYNYFNYYGEDNDLYPDFITFYPPTESTILANNANQYTPTQRTNIDAMFETDNVYYQLMYTGSNSKYQILTGYAANYSPNLSYLVPIDNATYDRWAKFCTFYSLSNNNNELTYTELLQNVPSSNTYYRIFYEGLNPYDQNDSIIGTINSYSFNDGTETTSSNVLKYQLGWYDGGGCNLPFANPVTIYKTVQTKQSIQNNTYEPSSYITDSYKDYSNNVENSFNTTRYAVDNSIQYNESIYNDSNDTYNNYYDNGYYDTSSQITNVTNITNNYYSQENPDNPVNPDNPDNPDTLEEILAAILRFFNAIGDIIGTILAGILNLITNVLEALNNVMADMEGMTDVFTSILGWLPEPIPQVIGAGVSICIVCGIIKFIRG